MLLLEGKDFESGWSLEDQILVEVQKKRTAVKQDGAMVTEVCLGEKG